MSSPKLIEQRPVSLADIVIRDRLRPVNSIVVETIKQSIEEIGLQDDIHLRRVRLRGKGEGRELRLMAGAHRLQAFLDLRRDTVPAKIWDCTNDQAKLMEIDDNLASATLEPLDLAIFLAERKAAYERMYPQTKHGAKGLAAANGNQTDKLSVWSFAATAAEQTGQSERNIRRIVAAGAALDQKAIAQLRRSPNRVSLSDLQVIAKCHEADERAFICAALSEGNAKSAAEARKQRNAVARPGEKHVDKHDAQARKLTDLFVRMSKAGKARFVSAHLDELRSLVAEAEASHGATSDVVPFVSRKGGAHAG